MWKIARFQFQQLNGQFSLSLHLISFLTKGTLDNVREVLAAIPENERTTKNLDLDNLPLERAVGLQWDTVKKKPFCPPLIQ